MLIAGRGADVIAGGTGIDTASFAGSAAGVTVNLATGLADGGDATGDVLIGVENLAGSSFDDVLSGTEAGSTIDGGAGIDTVSYAGSQDAVAVNLTTNVNTGGDAGGDLLSNVENVTGSAFNDVLTGDAAANTLLGGDGDDVLAGMAGADVIDGGAGNNTADYSGS
ncbi:hypothetical protein LTR94_031501, partial [Friedmanniomyces endolithicus]